MDTSFMKINRVALIILTSFLALTTVAGGIALTADLMGMPDEFLHGSPFSTYTVPGLALAIIVGGTALVATILLIRKSEFAYLFAASAGIVMMFFEFVEVQIIGAPAGIAQNLQIFYFGLGTLIVVISFGAWFLGLLSSRKQGVLYVR